MYGHPNAPMMAPPGTAPSALQARLGSSPQLPDAPPSQPLPVHSSGYHQHPMQPGQPAYPLPMPPAASGQKKLKLSGQIILLIVVGIVCISVFITGIVLFVTSR
jgi:hypothetical protein